MRKSDCNLEWDIRYTNLVFACVFVVLFCMCILFVFVLIIVKIFLYVFFDFLYGAASA